MAEDRVFNNVTNWSTYQDKQLDVLSSLEKTFSVSLSTSKLIRDNLTSLQSAMTSMIQSANSLASYVGNLKATGSGSGGRKSSNARAARDAAEQMRKNLEEVHRIEMQNQQDIYEQSMEQLEEQLKITRKELEGKKSAKKAEEDLQLSKKAFLEYIGKEAVKLMTTLGKMADNFMESSNNLIKVTGSSGSLVQGTRNAIVEDIVYKLNKETGGVYGYEDSYKKMVSIASEAGVGNTEAIKELTRPLLIADESLNANLGDIAKLFHRFYTRYSFSSIEMEEIVNEIRGNTAGNAATAQATVQNLSKLEQLISIYAGGDTDKMKEMMESISNYTSYLESEGINSASITDMIYNIMLGNEGALGTHVVAALDRAGYSLLEAQDLLRNDTVKGMQEVVLALSKGTEELVGGVIDKNMAGISLQALGIPEEFLSLYAAFSSPNHKSFEEFMSTTSDTPATEVIEDQFVSLQKKANNFLELIANKVANIAEKLGVSLTDIVTGIGVLAGIRGGVKLFKNFKSNGGSIAGLFGKGGSTAVSAGGNTAASASGSILGNVSGTGVAGKGILGAAEMGGFNASGGALVGGKAAALGMGTAAGVAAGAYGAYYGYSEGINNIKEGDTGVGAMQIAGGTAAGVGAGALTASLLGAGAAAGPVGWIALAVGAVLLVAADAIDKSLTVGAEKVVEKAYDEAAASVRKSARQQTESLLEIKGGLDRYNESIDSAAELEKYRSQLINSGILSEKDIEKARTENKDGLMKLTEAYLTATEQWSNEADQLLNKYKKSDAASAYLLHGDLEELLQDWNDSGKLTEGSDELRATEDLMFSLYDSLSARAAEEEFDKPTQKLYDTMKKVLEDGTLTENEANKIIDKGLWNTIFQNASFKPEELMRAVNTMGYANSTGKAAADKLLSSSGAEYYAGLSDQGAAELLAKAIKTTTTEGATAEDAKYYLDQLRGMGKTSKSISEIGDVAEYWGLTGYATGTNYITSDQIAYLHEGEAVVPKAYNPAANMNELETLREKEKLRLDQEGRESAESSDYIRLSYQVLGEIREFLSLWKTDNDKREMLNSAKEKHASSSKYLSAYLIV